MQKINYINELSRVTIEIDRASSNQNTMAAHQALQALQLSVEGKIEQAEQTREAALRTLGSAEGLKAGLRIVERAVELIKDLEKNASA